MSVLLVDTDSPGFTVGRDLPKLGYKGPETCELVLGYARERTAFGVSIANFQAIQLKIADMATEIQAARLLTYWAAAKSESSDGRVDMKAGMAKMYASEVAIKCALESMRIHGAYGYSAEFVVERLYRDTPPSRASPS